MRKRLFLLLGIVPAVFLAFGLAFAEQRAADSPGVATGTLVSVNPSEQAIAVAGKGGKQEYPLAKSVWVYRDEQKADVADLQPGDRVEISLNAKGQAAYVKAYSRAFGAQAENGPSGNGQASQQPETAGETAPAQGEAGRSGQMNPLPPSSAADGEWAALDGRTGAASGSVQLEPDPGQAKAELQLPDKPVHSPDSWQEDDEECNGRHAGQGYDGESDRENGKRDNKKGGHGKGKGKDDKDKRKQLNGDDRDDDDDDHDRGRDDDRDED